MSVEIKSGNSTDLATVDTNKALRVATNNNSTLNGILAISSRADDGAVTGSILDINPESDRDFRLRVGQDTINFQESWSGTILNTRVWNSNLTTMTQTVANGFTRLNASAITTVNTAARCQTWRGFNITKGFPLVVTIPFQIAAASLGIANTVWELGLGLATGVAAPTDGVFLRMNASGELRLVANFGGAETQSAPIDYTTILPNVFYQMFLIISAEHAEVWIDDVLYSTLTLPTGNQTFAQAAALPILLRIYNGAIAPVSATQLLIGPVVVNTDGMNNGETFQERVSMQGGAAYQTQSGVAVGTNVNYANSAGPSNAALSNSVPGYTTLGGQFSFLPLAGAETDYALFGFTVPAFGAGLVNKGLLIRGVTISTINLGAAVATTATILQWALGIGSTAASLATLDAATTRSPGRVALGFQSFAIGAAIGAQAPDIVRAFNAPLYVEPGTLVHVIVRLPVSTATPSQVIRGLCYLDAAFV